jgi:hypothetical protein
VIRTFPLRKQVARLGLLSFFGCLAIAGALWYSGQLRFVEQIRLPAGAVVSLIPSPHGPDSIRIPANTVLVRIGGTSGSDWFYYDHSDIAYSYGTHQFDALRQQGTQYHWRLELVSPAFAHSLPLNPLRRTQAERNSGCNKCELPQQQPSSFLGDCQIA